MDILASIRSVLHPLHREGVRFVALFAIATLILFLIWKPLGWLGVVLTLWCAYFFRDPPRATPTRAGLVVSPADGKVVATADAVPPAELGLGEAARPRISIFMSVFDVHVNRVPVASTVDRVSYRPGKFLNAAEDKASDDNERNSLRLILDDGRDLGVVQIAGLVARRIVCDAAPGQTYDAGQRFGIIRFGSRLDVYLPVGVAPLVAVGQRAVAGETVLADLTSNEGPRLAVVG
ncbi:phosphatidylserine decarboxylase [Zavarzinia compransoris]|uniref:Phosphatidylserine decarboxylase proenzyme n=1 Tax=Zavarzinia compransoris TaxID=1264899 RepID=A0A317E2V5_9PROT|nr:phosphatidylserine decarboxylase [Zavarzinia compransoris]PWR19713.1 phosphatidylserine decarboxylase family protein [Zavarzinia compransoris]TDP43340.1 phosphatidylserine decarboxylase [Zavarzinia compransoris]